MLCSVGLLALTLPLATALSSADIDSVLGAGNQLTGMATLLPDFTLSVMANKTHVLFSINATSTPPGKVGWFGVGPGMGMSDADIIVAWPAFSTGKAVDPMSSWTLSHRQAPGHVPPTVASAVPALSTNTFFTLIPALTTMDPASPFTVLSFVRLLKMPPDYPGTSPHKEIEKDPTSIIYASSSKRPATVAQDAPIAKHDLAHAALIMDLGKTADLVPVVGAPSAGSDAKPTWSSESWPNTKGLPASALPLTRRDKLLAAHAGIAAVALLFFSPLAILTARYFRHLPWFRIHASIQFSAYMLIVVSVSISMSNVDRHLANNHSILGIIIFAAMSIQIVLGATAHRSPQYKKSAKPKDKDEPTVFETVSGKPPLRLGHIAFGLLITILGWAQIRLGLEVWVEFSDSGRQVPVSVLIIFWALVGIESAEVFLGRFLKEEVHHNSATSKAASMRTGAASIMSRAGTGMSGLGPRSYSAMGRAMEALGWRRPSMAHRSSDDVTIVGDDEGAAAKGKEAKHAAKEAAMIRGLTV